MVNEQDEALMGTAALATYLMRTGLLVRIPPEKESLSPDSDIYTFEE